MEKIEMKCIALLALTFVFSMAQPSQAQLIIAHRGASHDAPENTIAAFKLAWEQEADGIEGDFHLTKDGQIVCIHDSTTKRTAGNNLKIASSTLEELRPLDVGAWKHRKWKGERIATLGEVLAIVPEGKAIFIEIKCGPEIVPELKRVLNVSKLKPTQTPVISFNRDVITAVKKQIPAIKAYWLTGYRQDKKTKLWSPTIASVLQTLRNTKADGLDTNAHACIDQPFIKTLRDAGMGFHCWTVDDAATAKRFKELGVDSITTNKPAVIRKLLNAAKP